MNPSTSTIPPLALGLVTGLSAGPLPTLTQLRDAGISTIHLQYPGQFDNADGIGIIEYAVRATGARITTVFCGFAGESYADIPTVINTVGLVPEATREARVEKIETIANFAQKLKVNRVGAHIGFMPEDAADPRHNALVETVRGVCDSLSKRGQTFALETGQETAQTLKRFIEEVARPNLRVNFDPANMILYGTEPPIPATRLLAPWIDGVHCKDGLWPTQKGELGREVPFGEGDVDARTWLQTLLDIGYQGPLTIEREISGPKQMDGVRRAKTLIESAMENAG